MENPFKKFSKLDVRLASESAPVLEFKEYTQKELESLRSELQWLKQHPDPEISDRDSEELAKDLETRIKELESQLQSSQKQNPRADTPKPPSSEDLETEKRIKDFTDEIRGRVEK